MKNHSKTTTTPALPGMGTTTRTHSRYTLEELGRAAELATISGCTGLGLMIRHAPDSGTVDNVPGVLRHYAANIIKESGAGQHPTGRLEWEAQAAALESCIAKEVI